jgi:NADPH:quinone reductase-like Zn-dependent oxidoreductase
MQQTNLPVRPLLNRSLEGQRLVIIGGTSGFGMATAKAASAEGASVIVASSKKTNVDRALAELPAGTEGHVLDITQESAVTDFFSTIGEFDHLAVTAGESLDLGEFATVDLEKGPPIFRNPFLGCSRGSKVRCQANQNDRIDHPDQWDHRFAPAKRMGHRCGNLRRSRSGHPRTSHRTGAGKSESRLCWASPNRTLAKHDRT